MKTLDRIMNVMLVTITCMLLLTIVLNTLGIAIGF